MAGEEDGVAATFEPGEVMQREFHVASGKRDLAAVLPMPVGARGAELSRQRLAVDEHFETTRRARGLPMGDPIFGAHPDTVVAGGRDADRARGIGHRFAQAMG